MINHTIRFWDGSDDVLESAPNDRRVPVEIETSVETKVDAINVTIVTDDRIEDIVGI